MAAVCVAGALGSGRAAGAEPARPLPTFAQTVVLTAISGVVRILVRGAPYGFVRLAGTPTVLPIGTLVAGHANRARAG